MWALRALMSTWKIDIIINSIWYQHEVHWTVCGLSMKYTEGSTVLEWSTMIYEYGISILKVGKAVCSTYTGNLEGLGSVDLVWW